MSNQVYKTVRHGDPVSFESDETVCFEHIIKDPIGIHARPAGEMIKLISQLACEVTVKNGDKTATGRSVIELMMLGASKGSKLELSVSGANAAAAAKALRQFMEEKL